MVLCTPPYGKMRFKWQILQWTISNIQGLLKLMVSPGMINFRVVSFLIKEESQIFKGTFQILRRVCQVPIVNFKPCSKIS